MILGHAHPQVIAAIQEAAARGTSYGAPTELEIELAEEVIEAFPSIELLRLTSSGTEATMSALRVARGFTGRPKIVKFEGCYHGHGDSLLVRSGVATLGLPDSPGVLPEVAQNTITVPFNDAEALGRVFDEAGDQIAAVIIEPVVGNMGCVPPGGRLSPGRPPRNRTSWRGLDLRRSDDRIPCRAAALSDLRRQGRHDYARKDHRRRITVGAFGGGAEIMEVVAPVGPVIRPARSQATRWR